MPGHAAGYPTTHRRLPGRLAQRAPPHVFFMVSALFHCLGPACAVLLFAHLAPAGVAWLRIASAAAVFALWRRPWRYFTGLAPRERAGVVWLGIVLALMNVIYYFAIARLPLSTVSAIEFLGPIALAALGMRTGRNLGALTFAVCGVYVLTDIRLAAEPLGLLAAFGNCVLFVAYIVLGHRLARSGAAGGIDRLAGAMLVAALAAAPIGLRAAAPALRHPALLAAGVGVGLCSSVIPYVCDQLAMARLQRATFALLLALLPAMATVIGLVVLGQIPTPAELLGVTLVIAGVGIHREPPLLGGHPG
jgi:inner membrane transporter RhtA